MTSRAARPAVAGPSRLRPFRALRYAATGRDLADLTLAPPAMWDFGSLGELARAHDHHVLRLLAPSLVSTSSALATASSTASSTAAAWLADGVLVADASAGLYVWRWSQQGSSVVGVAGALGLPAKGVPPHEQVRPGLLADRAHELGDGRVQPEPIMLLYDGALPLVSDDVEPAPLLDLRLDDGYHQVSRVRGRDAVARVERALAGESLVVADGHHRLAVLGDLPEPLPHAFVVVVDVGRSELAVGPIPRVLPGLAWQTVLDTPRLATVALDESTRQAFLAEPAPGRLRWVLGDRTRIVGLEAFAGVAGLRQDPSTCGPLARDVCHLHADLLPAWGVDSDRVRYAHSWPAACADASASDGLAVEARAASLADVLAAGRTGTVLPHKATSITPKPRAGLLMLGDEPVLG